MRFPKLLLGLLLIVMALAFPAIAAADDYGSYLNAALVAGAFDEAPAATVTVRTEFARADLPANFAAFQKTIAKTVSTTTTAPASACAPGDNCSRETTVQTMRFRVLQTSLHAGLFQNRPVRTFVGRLIGAVFSGRLRGGGC